MKLFKRLIISAVAAIATVLSAFALAPEAYAPQSVLSQGKWVKISVEQSGMHLITTRQLSEWGFKTPSAVRIYGYGGAMLPDVLDPEKYIDDLPQVAVETTARGLMFYAVGPTQILADTDGSLTHDVNPYDTKGYYFLTESTDSPLRAPAEGGSALESAAGCVTSGLAMLVHEQELVSPGGSGRMMVGEDFNFTRTRAFNFNLAEREEGTDVTVNCSFLAHSASSRSQVTFAVNGTALPAEVSDRIEATGSGEGYWGKQGVMEKVFPLSGSRLELRLGFECSGVVSKANLDYLEVIYGRALRGTGEFFSAGSRLAFQGGGAPDMRIWDVTDPQNPLQMSVGASSGAWSSDYSGMRHYVAWSTSAGTFPSPKLAERLSNQNLHAMAEVPDMVIICPTVYRSASEDIAEIHRKNTYDPLTVEVVELHKILNEFGSGTNDPGAIRRFLKMLYDRGQAAGTPLRYALMMGKGTCDNRALTGMGKAIRSQMPLWVSVASLAENQSFSSDDYFALLDDFDGQRPQRENLDIAVGRIPCTNVGEANTAVDKIRRYIYSQPRDDWHTRMTILVDDENDGVHMDQTEKLLTNLAKTPEGNRFVLQKVYCDAYERANSTYPQARRELFDYIADGTSIFAFIGHGSPTALGSKNIIQPNDFRDRFHLRRLPFFYAATCSFLKWDYDLTSMAEQLMFQADGGMIGAISALRPVFITQNGNLSAAFGTALSGLDDDGRELTVGELYRRAKNGVNNDVNKMRYVLMADPALRLGSPGANVRVETINGADATDAEAQIEVKACQELTITGVVTGSDGNVMEDFNGRVSATLYDAEYSVTSHGYGEGKQVTFERMGDKLLTASGLVSGGHFTMSARMPSTIADNYRPATLSLYAAATEASDLRHAMGVVRNIYAFGYDETAAPDTEAPIIHTLGLNSEEFKDGTKVNEAPLLIARISDNAGINISTAGVGRQMTVTIDGSESHSDAARHFTPDAEPTEGAMSGTLAYPLSGLSAGPHELRLRVWDVADNFSERTIAFNVVPGLKPHIYSVYTDANPASTAANFYIKHNRPEALMNVKVTVYNLMGVPVWSAQADNRSNMDVTEPIRWDLTDSSGKRVPRGIYIYRAEVSTDGEKYTTASRKLAVTANGTE